LRIVDDERGVVDVAPLAIERVVQGAALQNDAVQNAAARYATDELTVNISVTRARALPDILRAVRAQAHEQLAVHGLPELPVNVTVTGFLRTRRRELA
jgi:PleD family two-component response regulator